MNLFFEESGDFKVGTVLSQAGEAYQVEMPSGKRTKVKVKDVLLQYEKPAPQELLDGAKAIAADVDFEFLWEVAGQEEFGFSELGAEYFGHAPLPVEAAGLVLALHGAPIYFYKKGRGRYKAAPEQSLRAAQAGIEKKKQQALVQDAYVEELKASQLPAAMAQLVHQLLFKPDKNTMEYKALDAACNELHTTPPRLMLAVGGIASPKELHMAKFLFENFPRGAGFPSVPVPATPSGLPLADVAAFSIDDVTTTEIDDAFSVVTLADGTLRVGIHIAAPGLAIVPGTPLDQLGRSRLSTVYMPGYKITMLPDEVVQIYTLDEGRANPAVSLYVTVNEATLEITGTETRLERVPVVANLRHDQLDHIVTEAWLTDPSIQIENTPQRLLDVRDQLSFLHRLAKSLKAQREVVRGKPENFNRPDYNFRLVGNDKAEPNGSETVQITTRQRGAPLDLIVAEAAIVANSTWGSWMAELGVPGIYRSQASMAPGVKVRMGTKALPHAGIGVKSYSWATSPLRRYVDLVNQWQIIACVRNGRAAALAAPFKPKDAELFSIISSFDAAYSAYNGYQAGMERFWTLKYVEQNGITELNATVFKEGPGGSFLVRADELPLVFPVLGAQNLPRGARLKVKLGEVDEITLDLHGTVIERLDDPDDTSDDGPVEDAEDDEAVAGPIAIAVDVNEAETASPENPAP